jgi:hypothetical protein
LNGLGLLLALLGVLIIRVVYGKKAAFGDFLLATKGCATARLEIDEIFDPSHDIERPVACARQNVVGSTVHDLAIGRSIESPGE